MGSTLLKKAEERFVNNIKSFDESTSSDDKTKYAYASDELAGFIAEIKGITIDQAYDYLFDKYNLRKEG